MDYPSFADAVSRFRSFLNAQGHSSPIRWVFAGDVLLVADRWIIRPRPDALVVAEVAVAYAKATAHRLGVEFGVLCEAEAAHWCYVYSPADQVDAEYRMMPDGLKLCARTPLECGRLVADEQEWQALQAENQHDSWRWRFM